MSFLFNNTSSTNSSSNTATSGQSNSTASSSSTPTFSPAMQALMNELSSYSTESMTNPMQALAPIQTAGLQAINQSYNGVPGQVAQQMASRGYGSSGAAGDAMYKAGLARSGAVASFQGGLAQDAANQEQFGANLGEQLLNTGKGTSTTGSASGTTSGASATNGTSTTQQSGLGGILQSLAQLLMGTGGGTSTSAQSLDASTSSASNLTGGESNTNTGDTNIPYYGVGFGPTAQPVSPGGFDGGGF